MTPIWLEFAGGSNDGLKDGSQLTPSCVDALPTRLVSESVSMDYCRARAAEVVRKIWMTDIRLPSPKYHIEFNLAMIHHATSSIEAEIRPRNTRFR